MKKNLDITNFAVSLIIKAALIAARFSGRARKRSLRRLATMDNGWPAKNAGINPSKRDQEETEEPSIHPSREALHPLANGNISDTKAQSD
ncbi:MAG: hypothetical protein ACYSW0_12930 [Planctomycetota bacterium]|jgi:hypothetical protein